MTAVVFPEAVSAYANRKVVVLTTAPADLDAATVTEVEAGVTAGLELTMFLINSSSRGGGSQNKGVGPRRVGEVSQFQRLGSATLESPTLQYIHDPQGTSSDTANKPKTALVPGTEVWIIDRLGVDSETAWTAAQNYRLHHVRVGEQFPVPSGDGEFDIETITQETEYLTAPLEGVLAAGA
jgi:hypothetical protein